MAEYANCAGCGGYHGSLGVGIDCLIRHLYAARGRIMALEIIAEEFRCTRRIGGGFRRFTSPDPKPEAA